MIAPSHYLRYLIIIVGFIPMLNDADTFTPPLAKTGLCPSGYLSSGNYCLARDQAPATILKNGRYCPSGWLSSGDYCIKRD